MNTQVTEGSQVTEGTSANVRDEQNGKVRPKGALTSLVWDVADALSAKLARPPRQKEVADAILETGIEVKPSTIMTQYNRWRHYNGLFGRLTFVDPQSAEAKAEKAAEKERLRALAKEAAANAKAEADARKAEKKTEREAKIVAREAEKAKKIAEREAKQAAYLAARDAVIKKLSATSDVTVEVAE